MNSDLWTFKWNHLETGCHSIVKQIQDADFKPNLIIGISRGGLVPATMIAHALNVRRLVSFQAVSYEAGVQGAIQDLEDRDHLLRSIERANEILVVDDIVDSGNTMAYMRKRLKFTTKAVGYASLVVKEFKAPASSWPDFYEYAMQEPVWVTFPWEQATEQESEKKERKIPF